MPVPTRPATLPSLPRPYLFPAFPPTFRVFNPCGPLPCLPTRMEPVSLHHHHPSSPTLFATVPPFRLPESDPCSLFIASIVSSPPLPQSVAFLSPDFSVVTRQLITGLEESDPWGHFLPCIRAWQKARFPPLYPGLAKSFISSPVSGPGKKLHFLRYSLII